MDFHNPSAQEIVRTQLQRIYNKLYEYTKRH